MNPNIIVFVLDTMRYDEAIKYKDELAQLDFTCIENMYSTSPWTAPSHMSIFSGLYPIQHKLHKTLNDKSISRNRILKKYLPFMLPNILKKKYNYTTYLTSANEHITPFFGYSFFDHYLDINKFSGNMGRSYVNMKNKIDRYYKKGSNRFMTLIYTSLNLVKTRNIKIMVKWYLHFIKAHTKQTLLYRYTYSKISGYPKDKGIKKFIKKIKKRDYVEPFYEFVNFMEVHEPLSYRDDFAKNTIINKRTNKINKTKCELWKKQYSNASDYLMKNLMNLIDILQTKRLLKNTLIIITSDHGQLFGEHNRLGHAIFLYDELLKIPFFIRSPEGWGINNNNDNKKSLVNLNKFILDGINENQLDLSNLCSDDIFSESYGPYSYDSTSIEAKDEKKNIKKLNKYRIRLQNTAIDEVFNVSEFGYEDLDFNPILGKENQKTKKTIVKFLSQV